jgi:hypothetical protein
MNKSSILVTGIIVSLLALSCAPAISRSADYGTLKIAFGNSGARVLKEGGGIPTGWPGDALPAFSSITVKVSGSDMSPVTATATGYAGSLSIQVPAGSGRLVELTAVPASGSTAPIFAKSYFGSTTADLSEGQTTSVTIKLALSETKLILPGRESAESPFTLRMADSLKSAISSPFAEEPNGIAIDQYGRLFVSNSDGYVRRLTNLTGAPDLLGPFPAYPGPMAYDAARNRLYVYCTPPEQGDPQLTFVDLSVSTSAYSTVMIPEGYYTYREYYPIAVDNDGYLYIGLWNNEETFGIAKLAVTGSGQDFVPSAVVGFATDFGSSDMYWGNIADITVKDGILYLALSDQVESDYPENLLSRGKVVAMDTSTMGKLWETGWVGNQAQFPSPADRNKQFVSPIFFVATAPRKLYVADHGFYWGGGTEDGYLENVSRVIELDLDTKSFTDVGLDGTIFIKDFSSQFVYGSYAQYG